MSPRTGRPPVKNPKSDRITVRLTESQQKVLDDCAKKIGTSKADIICRGLRIMEIEKDNHEARQLFDALALLDEVVQKEQKDSPLVKKQIKQVENNFRKYLDSIKK